MRYLVIPNVDAVGGIVLKNAKKASFRGWKESSRLVR